MRSSLPTHNSDILRSQSSRGATLSRTKRLSRGHSDACGVTDGRRLALTGWLMDMAELEPRITLPPARMRTTPNTSDETTNRSVVRRGGGLALQTASTGTVTAFTSALAFNLPPREATILGVAAAATAAVDDLIISAPSPVRRVPDELELATRQGIRLWLTGIFRSLYGLPPNRSYGIRDPYYYEPIEHGSEDDDLDYYIKVNADNFKDLQDRLKEEIEQTSTFNDGGRLAGALRRIYDATRRAGKATHPDNAKRAVLLYAPEFRQLLIEAIAATAVPAFGAPVVTTQVRPWSIKDRLRRWRESRVERQRSDEVAIVERELND